MGVFFWILAADFSAAMIVTVKMKGYMVCDNRLSDIHVCHETLASLLRMSTF